MFVRINAAPWTFSDTNICLSCLHVEGPFGLGARHALTRSTLPGTDSGKHAPVAVDARYTVRLPLGFWG